MQRMSLNSFLVTRGGHGVLYRYNIGNDGWGLREKWQRLKAQYGKVWCLTIDTNRPLWLNSTHTSTVMKNEERAIHVPLHGVFSHMHLRCISRTVNALPKNDLR